MPTIPQGSGFSQEDSLTSPEVSLNYNQTSPLADTSLDRSDQLISERKKSISAIIKVAIISATGLLILTVIGLIYMQRNSGTSLQAGNFGEMHLPLNNLLASNSGSNNTQSLKVQGRLEVNSSLTLSPSSQPKNPLSGQLYFDRDRKQMQYFDGSQFVLLQGGAGITINNISTGGASQITQITNNLSSGTTPLEGTAGKLAVFTGSGTLGDSLIQQGTASLQVASSGANAVTVGSSSGASATTIQGGTGNIGIATGAASGITGSISITSGNSSTTASGNITIDSGSGIIDGEVIEDKTFESSLENMQNWFNTTIATTTAQAHSGSQSLQITPSSAFWGIIEIVPGTAVTPGHQYLFSIWIRASTTPRTINASVVWEGAGSTTNLTPTVDSTTGWTEITLTTPAPAGATAASFRIQTNTGAAGEVHYADDISITDLSSGTAISALDIGSTNAKVITIGNLNQIGATTIRGGSGISIQSGAASTVISAGALSVTGNAASVLNTTSGALTITSAATATWGIGTASSGVGGNLTIKGGQGGSDSNNDGGDLILQGGARNGTGAPGSVIIKPPNDVADAFQIQNSTGTPLLIANTTSMSIAVTGTLTTFALLDLDNTHLRSTQTNPPIASTPFNCGTTPAATVTTGSTDTAGAFSITTGNGGTASTCDTTVTFNKPYAAAPKSIIVVGKTVAASANRQIFVSTSTTTSFTTSFAVSAGGADATTYSFSYWVIE